MIISSRKNKLIARFRKLASSAGYRRESGEFVCDGIKLLREAVRWDVPVHEILTTEPLPDDIALPSGTDIYFTSPEVMDAASPLKTPQSVMFSAAIPENRGCGSFKNTLVLENVQDPGNVGTMIRTANAFGISAVALVGSCADVWSAKTVRASMGAVFRQRIAALTFEELKNHIDAPLYGASLGAGSADIRGVELRGAAVAIGSEGTGLSDALLSICRSAVKIPMSPMCESLNAAAAATVVCWLMSGYGSADTRREQVHE